MNNKNYEYVGHEVSDNKEGMMSDEHKRNREVHNRRVQSDGHLKTRT